MNRPMDDTIKESDQTNDIEHKSISDQKCCEQCLIDHNQGQTRAISPSIAVFFPSRDVSESQKQ